MASDHAAELAPRGSAVDSFAGHCLGVLRLRSLPPHLLHVLLSDVGPGHLPRLGRRVEDLVHVRSHVGKDRAHFRALLSAGLLEEGLGTVAVATEHLQVALVVAASHDQRPNVVDLGVRPHWVRAQLALASLELPEVLLHLCARAHAAVDHQLL